uniref:Rab-GAP TBC domain-containing protein n=1 Tax=Ascaris lumbricoides TaxID=6252 RepID=A0A0M3I1G8_ASCLU
MRECIQYFRRVYAGFGSCDWFRNCGVPSFVAAWLVEAIVVHLNAVGDPQSRLPAYFINSSAFIRRDLKKKTLSLTRVRRSTI